MLRELDTRTTAGGLGRVTLAWNDESHEVIIEIQSPDGDGTAVVPPECALDAFRHPYCYLPEAVIAADEYTTHEV